MLNVREIEKEESLVFYADVTKYVQNLLGEDLVVSAQVFLGERVALEKLSEETQKKVRKIVKEIADNVEVYFMEQKELEISNFDSWLEIEFVNGKKVKIEGSGNEYTYLKEIK